MKPNDKAIEAAIRYLEAPMSAREQMEKILTAAYAAQFQSENYDWLIKRLRGIDFKLRSTTANKATVAKDAADALDALLAERDTYKNWLDNYEKQFAAKVEELVTVRLERDALKAKNESMKQSLPLWAHKQMAANSALIERLRADLAAANTRMSKLDFERTAAELERDALLARLAPEDDEALVEIAADAISTYVPDQVSKWGSIKDAAIDAIAAIRPHIEAAERERCAKIVEGACTATNNPLIVKILHGNYQSLVDRDFKIAAAIRSGK